MRRSLTTRTLTRCLFAPKVQPRFRLPPVNAAYASAVTLAHRCSLGSRSSALLAKTVDNELRACIAPPAGRGGASSRKRLGRAGTKPIAGHFPKQVRDELKKLAIERDTTLQLLMAEAFNDLFAKYGRPEIAPTEKGR